MNSGVFQTRVLGEIYVFKEIRTTDDLTTNAHSDFWNNKTRLFQLLSIIMIF